MSQGVTLRFGEQSIAVREGETVLDALTRAQIPLASSCRSGICQTCLLQATEGAIPAAAQAGLSAAHKELGYLLACICRPETDMVLQRPGPGLAVEASLAARELLNEQVARLSLSLRGEMQFRPGQFIHVIRPDDGLSRPYSVASQPGEDIEIHVRVVPGGQMSGWLARDLPIGGALQIRGPSGSCFYTVSSPDQPLLLVGIGTGIAPLWGIANDALRRGHRGPIRVVFAAASGRGLYLRDALQALAARHPAVEVHNVALSADGIEGVLEGDLRAILPERIGPPKGMRVFLCGDPAMVGALRKQLFLAGASFAHISADAFVGSADAPR